MDKCFKCTFLKWLEMFIVANGNAFWDGIFNKQSKSLLNFWAIYFSSFSDSKIKEFLLGQILPQQ